MFIERGLYEMIPNLKKIRYNIGTRMVRPGMQFLKWM